MCTASSTSSQQDQQTTQSRVRSQLLVAATGLGKTVMMAGIAARWPLGKVMMMSHRYELNQQGMRTLRDVCGEEVALEQADYHSDRHWGDPRIVVASVQTLNSKRKGTYRFEKFDPLDFGLLMIDEAHRSAAATYRRVIRYFLDGNPDACLIGVTATPDRLDGVGLGHVYESVAADLNIRWAVDEGWLVPVNQRFVRVDSIDFDQVKTTGGDLDNKQLAEQVQREETLQAMAAPIADQDGQGIVFTASVEQAHRLTQILNEEYRPGCAVSVDGSLPPMHPRRRQLVDDFKCGRYQYLVNCGVATEGFDAPNVRFVAIGRPTKSRALYTQMLGRGTRALPGTVDGLAEPFARKAAIASSDKPHCLVLDFLGQGRRHRLVAAGDILAGDTEPPEIVDAAKKIIERDGEMDTLEAIERAKEEARAAREKRRRRLRAKVSYELEDLHGQAPSYEFAAVSGEPASEAQRKALEGIGYTEYELEGIDKGTAGALITRAAKRRQKGLCSLKQARLLKKFGYQTDNMTKAKASELIGRLAKNGWRRQ